MNKWRILIVDDSPAMRSFIQRVIQFCEFGDIEYYQAANGSEALAIIDVHRPHIVLTDINMPVMNGEEFLQSLSAGDRVWTPPVVVVSTDSTHTRVDRMLQLGARSYLKKPFTPESMMRVLEEALPFKNDPVGT